MDLNFLRLDDRLDNLLDCLMNIGVNDWLLLLCFWLLVNILRFRRFLLLFYFRWLLVVLLLFWFSLSFLGFWMTFLYFGLFPMRLLLLRQLVIFCFFSLGRRWCLRRRRFLDMKLFWFGVLFVFLWICFLIFLFLKVLLCISV